MFSFIDKLFNIVVKDIETMDAGILKGKPVSDGYRKKVPEGFSQLTTSTHFPLVLLILKDDQTKINYCLSC